MASKQIIEAVAVTAELCGRTFTPAAARMFVADLAGYPDAAVVEALKRCRREVRGVLTVQDVISRLDDGRPGPEQAWAQIPRDESSTVVWTEEMSAAYGVARPLIAAGELVPARMAFREAYIRLVGEARDRREPVRWTASLGHDMTQREHVLREAVANGLLTADQARPMLPHIASEAELALVEATKAKALSLPA